MAAAAAKVELYYEGKPDCCHMYSSDKINNQNFYFRKITWWIFNIFNGIIYSQYWHDVSSKSGNWTTILCIKI